MNLQRLPWLVTLCLAGFFLTGPAARAQVKEGDLLRTSPTFKKAFKEVVAKPSASTVRVLCDGKETALGMVVGPAGWVLTKANDLKGKITCKLKNGQEYDAALIGKQEAHDLALLKIEARGLVPVEFKDSKKAAVGEWTACVGLGDDPVAIGVISVGTRNVPASKFKLPKVDLSKSGYLGVQLEPGEGGVRVVQVMPDTAAAKAGVKTNDTILTLNGKAYGNEPEPFIQAMGNHKPGDVVTLKIRRAEEEKELKATLGKRPPGSNRGDMQDQMGSALSSRRTGYPTILQHDAVLKPADCGSPLVDLEGKVLGINVSRAGRTETWAVPSEVIQGLLFDLMSGRLPPKDTVAVKTPAKQDKLAELRSALKRAEEERTLAEKRLAEAKAALAKAEAEAKAVPDPKTDPRPLEGSRATQAVDRLLELMNQRLQLMTEVAKTKWNGKQPIEDVQRERAQLMELGQKGETLGLKKDAVEKFFQAQFDAARRMQELHHQTWAKSGQQTFPQTRDLKDLRRAIDQLNLDLLAALEKIQPALAEEPIQLRLLARSGQVLGGLRTEVRNRALEPLLKK